MILNFSDNENNLLKLLFIHVQHFHVRFVPCCFSAARVFVVFRCSSLGAPTPKTPTNIFSPHVTALWRYPSLALLSSLPDITLHCVVIYSLRDKEQQRETEQAANAWTTLPNDVLTTQYNVFASQLLWSFFIFAVCRSHRTTLIIFHKYMVAGGEIKVFAAFPLIIIASLKHHSNNMMILECYNTVSSCLFVCVLSREILPKQQWNSTFFSSFSRFPPNEFIPMMIIKIITMSLTYGFVLF